MARINPNYALLKAGYLFPEINRRTKLWSEAHPEVSVMRLGIGNTTEELPKVLVDAMKKKLDLLSDRNTYTGYGDEQGDGYLRRALTAFYKEQYGVELDPTEFFVSDGAKSDAANIQEIFAKDCKIALQDPAYPVYVDTNVIAGRGGDYNEETGGYSNFVYLNCNKENNFIPDLPKEKVDLIYLCFPNNPTGQVITKPQLKAFVDWARENKAVIIYDAAYSAYIEDEEIPRTIFEIEGAKECAIEINSFSKNAGFTGVRLGWTIVPKALVCEDGCECTLNNMWNRRQTTYFNGACNIAQAGGAAALSKEGYEECQKLVNYYKGNAKIIKEGLESIGLTCFGGKNSPYVWVNCPSGLTSWQFFDLLLDKCHVIVTPGSGFGPMGEGYVRVSAYGHRETVEKAIASIKENYNA